MAVVVAILLGLLTIAGCGGFVISSNGCLVVAFRIAPDRAMVDHTAATPGNTVIFTSTQTTSPISCFDQSNVVFTASDPQIVSVTNTGQTTGTATCLRSSPDPVTITATMTTSTGKRFTSSSTLVCR